MTTRREVKTNGQRKRQGRTEERGREFDKQLWILIGVLSVFIIFSLPSHSHDWEKTLALKRRVEYLYLDNNQIVKYFSNNS